MKITKYSDDMDPYKIAENLARKECKVCPCCGRRESVMERWCDNKKTVGIVHRKTINYLSFRCCSCGAMWDSEPFETGEKQDSLLPYIIVPLFIYAILVVAVYLSTPEAVWCAAGAIWIPISMLSFSIAGIRNVW